MKTHPFEMTVLTELRELDAYLEGSEDINNNGGPNDAMRVRQVLAVAIPAVADLLAASGPACDWIEEVAQRADEEGEIARRLRAALDLQCGLYMNGSVGLIDRCHSLCSTCKGWGGWDVPHESGNPALERWQACQECLGYGTYRFRAADPLEVLHEHRSRFLRKQYGELSAWDKQMLAFNRRTYCDIRADIMKPVNFKEIRS